MMRGEAKGHPKKMGTLARLERAARGPPWKKLSRGLSTPPGLRSASPSRPPTSPQYVKHADHAADEAFVPPGKDGPHAVGLRRLPFSNIFVGPNAGRCPVTVAEFVKSSTDEADCPADGLPEFAVLGRSNVGKSSLVNSLVQRRRLAKTSKTPGKTQLINHFIIDRCWYLVDLPGYGFAEAPTQVRNEWDSFTKNYLVQRKTLVSVLLLIDSSVVPKIVDLAYIEWLHSKKIPVTIVFTKSDKRRRKRKGNTTPNDNVGEFGNKMKVLLRKVPPWIMTSCKTNQGRDELLVHLAQLRSYWKDGLAF